MVFTPPRPQCSRSWTEKAGRVACEFEPVRHPQSRPVLSGAAESRVSAQLFVGRLVKDLRSQLNLPPCVSHVALRTGTINCREQRKYLAPFTMVLGKSRAFSRCDMTGCVRLLGYIFLLAFTTAAAASADPVVLTFEGIQSGTLVGNHYLQFGITFSDAGRASVSELDGGNGNYVSPPPPGITSLALIDGGDITPSALAMNVSGGFKSTLSFDYIAATPGTLTLYSGFAGAGSVLGIIGLPVTATCSSGPTYCQWQHTNIDFVGTAASAVFVDQHLNFVVDNIALDAGRETALTPEPASLLLLCTGIAGVLMRRRTCADSPLKFI